MFEYVHHDGRRGVGYSPWSAVMKALGVLEAHSIPPVKEPAWKDREADLILKGGMKLGTWKEV